MSGKCLFLRFSVAQQQHALPLATVWRVVRMVEITSLPGAPGLVEGVINVQGKILPVFNLRKRVGLPERSSELSDRLIIAETPTHTVALHADSVQGVIEKSEEQVVSAEALAPGTRCIKGVMSSDDALIVIDDLDKFLLAEEGHVLAAALREAKRQPAGGVV